MSDYTPIVDFSAKDALSSGDPNKVIKGAEQDAELDAISAAIVTKADDSTVVHNTGTETIDGDKTFTGNNAHSGNETHTGTVTMTGKSIIEANASIAAHATTMNPWSLGNYVTCTGSAVTFTAMNAAPQAGAEVELYMNAAHVWTDGAVFEVDGDATWTAEAGDRVLLRAKSTTVFTVHPIKKTGETIIGRKVLEAPVTVTSGTSVSLTTTIPSWAKRITVILNGISTNGSTTIGLRIGPSGGVETSGYLGTCSDSPSGSAGNHTNRFNIIILGGASSVSQGIATFSLHDASTNTWALSSLMGRSDAVNISISAGIKPLAGVLTQIDIYAGGTDTFDATGAGKASVMYE